MADQAAAKTNEQSQRAATALLYELIQQALTMRKARKVTLEIPLHGDRLGTPVGAVIREG